ncbi:MAG: GNAT family N-acetyltransferase [Gammaproteobacteria bacterium]|nr:MAG: GNAT family N-acetyltransferase [Gammaproteobacteria bacterium]
MSKWLKEAELKGTNVTLTPLTLNHRDGIIEAASDGNLWELWFTGVPSEKSIDDYLAIALSNKEQGSAMPYVVIDNASGKLIGGTRFCNATPDHRRVEIGYTWYSKSYQRTLVNTECKLLLLSYAFERLDSIAVEFRTHWYNQQSRNAILRLGAKQDGVLRNHSIEADGTLRDTVVFSILNSEWPAVKKSLVYRAHL